MLSYSAGCWYRDIKQSDSWWKLSELFIGKLPLWFLLIWSDIIKFYKSQFLHIFVPGKSLFSVVHLLLFLLLVLIVHFLVGVAVLHVGVQVVALSSPGLRVLKYLLWFSLSCKYFCVSRLNFSFCPSNISTLER